jgi:hypothetical protein
MQEYAIIVVLLIVLLFLVVSKAPYFVYLALCSQQEASGQKRVIPVTVDPISQKQSGSLRFSGWDARAGGNLDFRGRHVKQQLFFIASFPGIYEMECKKVLEAEKIAAACIFFRRGHATLSGAHTFHASAGCNCLKLYGPDSMCYKSSPFDSWPEGKAPWGCAWMAQWQANCTKALGVNQVPIVIYKRKGDDGSRGAGDNANGLGNSQKGEVAWLEDNGHPYIAFDVDELGELIRLSGEQQLPDRKPHFDGGKHSASSIQSETARLTPLGSPAGTLPPLQSGLSSPPKLQADRPGL